MRTLKTNGLEEIRRLISRTLRALALGRISEDDSAYIVSRLRSIEYRILNMNELNEDGEPEEILSATESSNEATG